MSTFSHFDAVAFRNVVNADDTLARSKDKLAAMVKAECQARLGGKHEPWGKAELDRTISKNNEHADRLAAITTLKNDFLRAGIAATPKVRDHVKSMADAISQACKGKDKGQPVDPENLTDGQMQAYLSLGSLATYKTAWNNVTTAMQEAGYWNRCTPNVKKFHGGESAKADKPAKSDKPAKGEDTAKPAFFDWSKVTAEDLIKNVSHDIIVAAANRIMVAKDCKERIELQEQCDAALEASA